MTRIRRAALGTALLGTAVVGYVDSEDCAEHSYVAGTAFVDPGHGHTHTAYNPGGVPAVLVATFFEAPAAPAPLLIPADAPEGCDV